MDLIKENLNLKSVNLYLNQATAHTQSYKIAEVIKFKCVRPMCTLLCVM